MTGRTAYHRPDAGADAGGDSEAGAGLGAVRAILVAFPVLLLAVMAIAWVRYGVDLPLIDDWRDFEDRTAGSLAFADLFRPANDTLYATGKLLDALAVRFLAYNGIVYQLLTMILCLGAILALYHRLLFRSAPPLPAALAFLATIFMLQPYSYWGLQNLAYHQILPILFLLIGLRLVEARRVPDAMLGAAFAALALLGGFAYISGAFLAATSACVVLALSTRGTPAVARRLRYAVAGLAVGAAVTLPAQLWVILVVQDGQTHSAAIPWTMPWELDFWAFLFGLVGRAVRAQALPEAPALALTALVVLALLLTAFAAWRTVATGGRTLDELRLPLTALTLFAGVGFYALMIAAGRASHGATPEESLYGVFGRSGNRFHYYWITFLLPFVVLHLASSLRSAFRAPVAGLLALALVVYAHSVGAFAHAESFRGWAKERIADAACVQEKILAERPIVCGTIMPADLTVAVDHARSLGISFTHHLLFPEDLTVEGGGVFADETFLGAPAGVRVEGARAGEAGEAVLLAEAGADPQLLLDFPDGVRGAFSACRVLRVKGTVTAERGDVVQLFATTPDSPDYGEAFSDSARYDGGGPQAFDLTVGTPSGGFLPAIRLDPGQRNDAFRVEGLSVSCR